MTERAIPRRAIFGWDSVNEVWVKVAVDEDGKVKITNTDLTTVLSEIQNETYGLEALKAAIDAIEAGGATAQQVWEYVTRTLTAVPSGSALETTLTAMKGEDWSSETLKAIKDAIDTIDSALPSDPADESLIEAAFNRKIHHIDFWSVVDDVIAVTATADQDYNLPDVVIPTLPTGITIWKVVVLFKCALIRDTSGANNGIDEAGLIRVKKNGEDFDVDGVTAFAILDDMWLVDVTNVGRDRAGDVLIGDINGNNISSKIDGAATYNLRLDSISADGNNLELHDIQVGLRVYYY